MPAAGVTTIALALVIVAALVVYLVRVALVLKRVNSALRSVIAGVEGIEVATRPVTPILESIAGDLGASQKALEDLLASKAARRSVKPMMVSRLPQRGR